MHIHILEFKFRTLPAARWGILSALALLAAGNHRLLAATVPIDWFSISGETRVRYETLDGQFRIGGSGGDQLLLLRTLVHVRSEFEPFALGVEVQDSRSYLGDEGTPISSSFVNPVDFLQIYGSVTLPETLGGDWNPTFTAGRQTISIGSKRQIERISFANVIKSYTGGYLRANNGRGDEFHAFVAVPVGRYPRRPPKSDLLDNKVEMDREEWNRQIWGLHYRRAEAVPSIISGLWIEAFVYGLHETDTDEVPTPNRNYVTPGMRMFRARQPGKWDLDIECALRFGSRRATSLASDTEDLTVFASMVYATVGYTFDAPWRTRFALQYYWASGDRNPNDGRFDQYERLFGSRRSDLNNTSIHGPLTPANLNAPGARFSVEPSDRSDARLSYYAAFLASDTDAWVIAGLRDPTGQSGRFIGHAIDVRYRYWIDPEQLRLSVGASALLPGRFSENAPGSPDPGTTLYGYTSISFYF